jgi:hypothetical protein
VIVNRIKADILALSKRDLLVWLAASIIVAIFHVTMLTRPWGGTPIAPAINTINLVANILVHSLPICLAASLLFSSKNSRKSFVNLTMHDKNLRKVLIFRFSNLVLLTTLYFGAITVIFFIAQGRGSLSGIEYIPALIFAAFLVGVLLCSVGTCIALAFDDWRFSTIGTCAIIIVIAWFGGVYPDILRYSAVPDLALIAPHNLYRALAVLFTGYHFGSLSTMEMYVGFIFEPLGLVIPITGFVIISSLSWLLASKLFEEDLKRWALESTVWLEKETLDDSRMGQIRDSAKQQSMIDLSHTSLNRQRRLAGMVIAMILIITPLGSMGYTSIRQGESVTAQYQSPAEGDTVSLGHWFAVELVIPAPPEGQDNWFSIECEVIDWNGCPDTIVWKYGFQEMSLEDFQALNDTSKEEMFGNGGTRHKSDPSFGTGNFNYQFSSGTWVWACRFTDPNSNSTIGYLRVLFDMTVTVR